MPANNPNKRASIFLKFKDAFNGGAGNPKEKEKASRDEIPSVKQPTFKSPSFKPRKPFERAIPTRPRVPLPSYAEIVPHNPREKIPASEPRECRQMLRELYALNIFILNCTHVFEANKPLIREKEQRAAAALTDMRQRVETWLAIEGDWTEKEMQTIIEIHELIKEMQPIPVPFDQGEEIPSDRNDTASMATSYA